MNPCQDCVFCGKLADSWAPIDSYPTHEGFDTLNIPYKEGIYVGYRYFDSFGITRSSLITVFEGILNSEHDKVRNNISGQMDLFSMAIGGGGGSSPSYDYPDIPEYGINELLYFEKENSGMYFSGHMVDGYKKHIEATPHDRISDIMYDLSDESQSTLGKYRDKSQVTVAGIISAKKTKIIKNGDTMAFITLEDGTSEIEIIVFARQYQAHSELLLKDNAVIITGNISTEEGEAPKLLLSDIKPLLANSDFDEQNKNQAETEVEVKKEIKLYIKVQGLNDPRIDKIIRMATLNPGKTKIVLYDETTGKYSQMKNALIDCNETVVSRLKKIFSDSAVVIL